MSGIEQVEPELEQLKQAVYFLAHRKWEIARTLSFLERPHSAPESESIGSKPDQQTSVPFYTIYAGLRKVGIDLSELIASTISRIPGRYEFSILSEPEFYIDAAKRPPFVYTFDFPVHGPRNYNVRYYTDAIYAKASSDDKRWVEITATGIPLLHLPKGYQMKMHVAGNHMAEIQPYMEGATEEDLARRFYVYNGQWLSAIWQPELTEEPKFIRPKPFFIFDESTQWSGGEEWEAYIKDPNGKLETETVGGFSQIFVHSF